MTIYDDVYFGLLLTIGVFYLSIKFLNLFKIKFLNPLILSLVIIIMVLLIFRIPYESYYKGGEFLNLLITPATVALALPLYKSLHLIKKHFFKIFFSITITSVIICILIVVLSYFMKLDLKIIASILPKSITTAIGVEISYKLNGIISVTIIAIIITGNLGMLIAPLIFNVFNINDPIARGIALGTSAHAMGTVKAMEYGEVEGAMSGIAMSITGIVVVFIAPIVFYIYKLIIM